MPGLPPNCTNGSVGSPPWSLNTSRESDLILSHWALLTLGPLGVLPPHLARDGVGERLPQRAKTKHNEVRLLCKADLTAVEQS